MKENNVDFFFRSYSLSRDDKVNTHYALPYTHTHATAQCVCLYRDGGRRCYNVTRPCGVCRRDGPVLVGVCRVLRDFFRGATHIPA